MCSEFREQLRRKEKFEDFGRISGLVRALVKYKEHASHEDAVNATGTRLEQLQKGAPYQKGDRFMTFDKDGGRNVLVILNIISVEGEEGKMFEVKSEREEKENSPFLFSEKEADLFCRGNRMSLVSALDDVYDVLSNTTVALPSDVTKLILEVQRKMKSPAIDAIDEEARRRGIELPEYMLIERDFANAIPRFYYGNPPDYDGLLKALSRIAEHQQKAIGSVRRGERVGRILPQKKDQTEHFDLLRQVLPIHQTPLFDVLINRYEGRVNTTERAMLYVLNLMQEETGTVPFVMEWRQDTPET